MKPARLVYLVLLALAACGGGGDSAPHQPPVITLVSPANGARIEGTTHLELTAIGDAAEVKEFLFVEPVELIKVRASFDPASRTATLEADIDAGAHESGTLTVLVIAEDSDGHWANAVYHFVNGAR